ncbi:tudor domain-containing protein 6 [Crotalus adamanteus]|uniref:Tudor domain-containing protein 6 n=1 Tax=Crotalus adamanteus TaxID=8729 RepID=A0AAW1CA40_CROAD
MCSPLLIPGSSITFRVSFVEVHPKVPLVRLWGLPGERREEYLRLMKDIQIKVGPRLANAPGDRGGRGDGDNDGQALALGDLCLVELGGRWHRCRIVSCRAKPGQNYRVFLLDEGRTVSASSYYLARGRSELFHLPSEVMGCIIADLLPPGEMGASLATTVRGSKSFTPLGSQMLNLRWAAEAVDFLGFLHGKELSGVIRKLLISQCLVVLEVPWLLTQMRHLGLASLASTAFGTLLSAILEVPEIASVPLEPTSPLSQAPVLTSSAQSKQDQVTMDFFYPQLELNVTVAVVVTQISDPYRIYCQLRSLSKEIQLLSDAMYQAFELSKGKFVEEALPTPGFPCAAQGMDGGWYRALLLEIYPADDQEDQPEAVAQVICVDYGRKEFVTKRHLRNLPAEYFRMPVVTYPCSLQGLVEECKLGKSDNNPNFTEGQTALRKNYGEMQMSIHGSFKDNMCVEKDYLTNIQLSEVNEALIHDTEKKENICNLMGFDIGSQCMVRSGAQWYKAEILDISAEGTKVLNLSNGNEEIVNPIHVWNGIPELDSDLTQIISKNKTDILHSVPATILAMEVGEMTHDSDDSTND